MSEDRELLELAAKAAGLSITWGEKYYVGGDEVDCTDIPYVHSDSPDESPAYWNPLEDDGDALRLGASLRMGLHYESQFFDDKTVRIVEVYHSHDDDGNCQCVTEPYTDDPLAATRRAIVRAAAAIAKE